MTSCSVYHWKYLFLFDDTKIERKDQIFNNLEQQFASPIADVSYWQSTEKWHLKSPDTYPFFVMSCKEDMLDFLRIS